MANLKEIQEFLENLAKTDLHKVKIKTDELELSVQLKPDIKITTSAQIPQPVAHNETPQNTTIEKAEPVQKNNIDDGLLEIKSTMVGTFYKKPSPDKPAFVEIGQKINSGDVICIIEAMKLFNEIEAEVSGEIVKILLEDGSPVEFEQPLFLVKPL